MITGEDHTPSLLHFHSRHGFKSLLNIVSHNKQESRHPNFLKVNLDCPTGTQLREDQTPLDREQVRDWWVIFLLFPSALFSQSRGGGGLQVVAPWIGNRKVAVGRASDCEIPFPQDKCSHYLFPDPSITWLDWLTYSKLEQELNPHNLNAAGGDGLVLQAHGLYPSRLLCSWDFPGKNPGVHWHFLLQEIFWTQRSNLGLLRCRQTTNGATREAPPILGPLLKTAANTEHLPGSGPCNRHKTWVSWKRQDLSPRLSGKAAALTSRAALSPQGCRGGVWPAVPSPENQSIRLWICVCAVRGSWLMSALSPSRSWLMAVIHVSPLEPE